MGPHASEIGTVHRDSGQKFNNDFNTSKTKGKQNKKNLEPLRCPQPAGKGVGNKTVAGFVFLMAAQSTFYGFLRFAGGRLGQEGGASDPVVGDTTASVDSSGY